MDKYENFKIGNRISRVRLVVPEVPTYSTLNPNPSWYVLGTKWLEYISTNFQSTKPWDCGEPDRHNDIAYIPSVQLAITLDRPKPHFVLPTEWDLRESPHAANFSAYKGGIRLNARNYEGKSGEANLVGRKHNVDLDINKDADIIFDLLKLAERIHMPPDTD